jgi:hypothetical protein
MEQGAAPQGGQGMTAGAEAEAGASAAQQPQGQAAEARQGAQAGAGAEGGEQPVMPEEGQWAQQGGGQAGEEPQREQAQGEQQGGGQPQQAQGERQDDEPVTTGAINLSAEQETTIRRTIVETDVEPVTDLDVDLNIGVRIPQTVDLHPLPPDIVRIVPDYEGYRYFILADGTIVIVDPDSLTVVYVLTA